MFSNVVKRPTSTLMREALADKQNKQKQQAKVDAEQMETFLLMESTMDDTLNDEVIMMAESFNRAEAMSVTLEWANHGPATVENMAIMAEGLNVEDEELDEVDDLEEEDVSETLTTMAEALMALGAGEDDVKEMMMEESDDAADRVRSQVLGALDSCDKSDLELITTFAIGGNEMMESAGRRRRVVRDGKVMVITKPLRKKRLTSAQKQALKKARRKAGTSAAKLKRKKALKIRKQRGM